GALEIKGPGIPELAEEIERLAVILCDFYHDPGLFDVFLESFLQFLPYPGDGKPFNLYCAEKRQVDAAVAVHPAPGHLAGSGRGHGTEFRFAGNGNEEHITDTDNVIE